MGQVGGEMCCCLLKIMRDDVVASSIVGDEAPSTFQLFLYTMRSMPRCSD